MPPPPGTGTSLTSSSWTEHDAPDGRKYYYNRATKKSTYEKPKELYTARERFVDENCAWKATYDKTSEKYYYYNRETKETRWEMPEELRRTEKRWDKMTEEKMKRENTTAIGKEGGGEGGQEEQREGSQRRWPPSSSRCPPSPPVGPLVPLPPPVLRPAP